MWSVLMLYFGCFALLFLEIGSHVAQDGLKLTIQLTMILIFSSPQLHSSVRGWVRRVPPWPAYSVLGIPRNLHAKQGLYRLTLTPQPNSPASRQMFHENLIACNKQGYFLFCSHCILLLSSFLSCLITLDLAWTHTPKATRKQNKKCYSVMC